MTKLESTLRRLPMDSVLDLLEYQIARRCEEVFDTLQNPAATREDRKNAQFHLAVLAMAEQPLLPSYCHVRPPFGALPGFELARDRLSERVIDDPEKHSLLTRTVFFAASRKTLRQLGDRLNGAVEPAHAVFDAPTMAAGLATGLVKPRTDLWPGADVLPVAP